MCMNFSKWIFTGVLAGATGVALAYPVKPLTIIVPFAAGTVNDLGAREMAKVLSAVAQQAVVVENRVGAEGTIGTQAMLNSAADGHTMVFVGIERE